MRTTLRKNKVLYVKNGDFENGGVETFIKNYYDFLIKSGFEIDFLIHSNNLEPNNDHAQYYKEKGSNIYYVPTRNTGLVKHLKLVNNILRNNTYDIIHSHAGASAFLTFLQAKYSDIPIRISHSHGSSNWGGSKLSIKKVLSYIVLEFSKAMLPLVTTNYAACANYASEFLYGKNPKYDVKIIKNAIDTTKFEYNLIHRKEIRKYYEINNDTFIIGQIGRLDNNKNQKFSIELIKKLKDKYKIVMFIIGNGSEYNYLVNYSKEIGVYNNIIFITETNNVEKYLSAMDIILLPSYHEGLPLVAIESQASGLTLLVSDTISEEIKLTDRVHFISLKNKGKWQKTIESNYLIGNSKKRSDYASKIVDKGYDIRENSEYLIKWYNELIEEVRNGKS